MPEILYICDKYACGFFCPNDLCNHTHDVTHAANFMRVDGKYVRSGNTVYLEKEPSMDEIKTTTDNPGAVVDPVETKEIAMAPKEEQKADRRFWNFLDMVYKLAKMSGLYIEGHIRVRDKRTGKVWE